jgi:hypothetical protein
MPVKYKRNITQEDLESSPDVLFLYCENNEFYGDDNIAKFRGEENAVGIRMKLQPGNSRSAHIDEENSFEGMGFLDEDFQPVLEHAKAGGMVVIPTVGFIPSRLCETVRDYLMEILERLKDED